MKESGPASAHRFPPLFIAWLTPIAQRIALPGVVPAMSFFRTRDRQRDRSIDEAARLQRRQQQQIQKQLIEQQQAAVTALQPVG